MCCKKEPDDGCHRLGSYHTVKPIVTLSQPSDLSNYSPTVGTYRYKERVRWFLSGALYLSLQSIKPPLLTPVQPTLTFFLFLPVFYSGI